MRLLVLVLGCVMGLAAQVRPEARDFIRGSKVLVPTAGECRVMAAVDIERLAEHLGNDPESLCATIALGVLPAGKVLDMAMPINAFQHQFNVWLRLKQDSVRLGMVDYKEATALRKLEKSFKAMVDWADRDRQAQSPEWVYDDN